MGIDLSVVKRHSTLTMLPLRSLPACAALASKAYSETAPSVTFGNYSFVRRGSGARKGTYAYSERGGLKRLSPMLGAHLAAAHALPRRLADRERRRHPRLYDPSDRRLRRPVHARVEEAPRTLPTGVRSASGGASTLFQR